MFSKFFKSARDVWKYDIRLKIDALDPMWLLCNNIHPYVYTHAIIRILKKIVIFLPSKIDLKIPKNRKWPILQKRRVRMKWSIFPKIDPDRPSRSPNKADSHPTPIWLYLPLNFPPNTLKTRKIRILTSSSSRGVLTIRKVLPFKSRHPQLSNALSNVKKYWKLAFLWRFENFLSLLVRAKKGLFGPYIGFLRLKTPEKCCLRPNFKVLQTIRFLLFFAESFTRDTSNILL